MEDKLDIIIKNQEVLYKNQAFIYKEILRVISKLDKASDNEFIINYIADLAGTATNILGFEDILKNIKKG